MDENRDKNITKRRTSSSDNGLKLKSNCSKSTRFPSLANNASHSFSSKRPIRLELKSTACNRGARGSTSVARNSRKHAPSNRLLRNTIPRSDDADCVTSQPTNDFVSSIASETPSNNNACKCDGPRCSAENSPEIDSVICGLFDTFNRRKFSAKGDPTNSSSWAMSLVPTPVCASSNSSNNGAAPCASAAKTSTRPQEPTKLSDSSSRRRFGAAKPPRASARARIPPWESLLLASSKSARFPHSPRRITCRSETAAALPNWVSRRRSFFTGGRSAGETPSGQRERKKISAPLRWRGQEERSISASAEKAEKSTALKKASRPSGSSVRRCRRPNTRRRLVEASAKARQRRGDRS